MNTAGLKGTISAGNPSPVVVPVLGAGSPQPPYSVVFTTAAGAATFSFDGGTIYQTIAASISAGGQLVYYINQPITHVKFTGANTETYQIL
jgi:hypothetical protein